MPTLPARLSQPLFALYVTVAWTACAGSSPKSSDPTGSDAQNKSPSGVDAAAHAGGGADVEFGPCGRKTKHGDRICCGSPSEKIGVSCVDLRNGGSEFGEFGRCLKQGEGFDARIAGAVCCDPLIEIDAVIERTGAMVPDFPPGCDPQTENRKYCSACGNGSCDESENACNCPADCQRK